MPDIMARIAVRFSPPLRQPQTVTHRAFAESEGLGLGKRRTESNCYPRHDIRHYRPLFHSCLSETRGSMRAAWRVGSQHATRATAIHTATAADQVTASVGLTPWSSVASSREAR